MGIINTVIAAGISPFAASAITGGFTNTITAAGTTQGTATLLSTGNNFISTVAASGAGVQLPACDPASSIFVWNGGANSAHVYGQTGEILGAGTANSPFVLATKKGVLLVKGTATQWGQALSA